jgi:hypothetical protein
VPRKRCLAYVIHECMVRGRGFEPLKAYADFVVQVPLRHRMPHPGLNRNFDLKCGPTQNRADLPL